MLVDAYLDIVYRPVRDPHNGSVTVIVAQATDVTESVLSRQVSDHREQKLHRLWTELESIYSIVPIGLAVIDAVRLRLIRTGDARQMASSLCVCLHG